MSKTSTDAPEKSPLAGIRGWLILVAIWVIAVPVASVVGLVEHITFLGSAAWQMMNIPGSPAWHPMLKLLVMGEITGTVIALVWSIILAVFFFKRNSRFPNVATAFIVFAAAARILDVLFGRLMYEQSVMDELGPIAGLLIVSAIGILYLHRSKRVRATFVTGSAAGL